MPEQTHLTEKEKELERRLERLEFACIAALNWLNAKAPGRAYAVLERALEKEEH